MNAPKVGEPGSKLQSKLEREQGLAEQYLAEAKVQDLYALYQERCKELEAFSKTLLTMAEIYAGKGERAFPSPASTPEAVAAMERVALAAIELAKSFASKGPAK